MNLHKRTSFASITGAGAKATITFWATEKSSAPARKKAYRVLKNPDSSG
jgi:hypothetical protein